MSAQQRQKQSGNTYNLRNQVEIPTALQVSDDGTLPDEFSSQAISGQALWILTVILVLVFANNVSKSDSELV